MDLFNCCTGGQAPDWTQYDALETQAVKEVKLEKKEDSFCEPCAISEATFFTVYAHLKEGGVECITDCDTIEDVREAAKKLSALSGLRLTYEV